MTLNMLNYNHGFQETFVSWWPLESSNVGIITCMWSLSSIKGPLYSLLFCIKNSVDSLMMVCLMLVKSFLMHIFEQKLYTYTHLSRNQMFGLWKLIIVKWTFFIYQLVVNLNGVDWSLLHNHAIIVFVNGKWCHHCHLYKCWCWGWNQLCWFRSWQMITHRWSTFDNLPPPMNLDVSCVTYTTKTKTQIIPANIAPCCYKHYCFRCVGPHLKVDCQNNIPFTLNNCATCHMIHSGPTLGNVSLQEEKYDVNCESQFQGEHYHVLVWAIWRHNCLHIEKILPELKDINNDK